MKRIVFTVFAMAALVVGCQKKHPVKVYVAPDYDPTVIEKIAVFPFTSSLHHSDDPDDIAPKTMDALFRHELDGRSDYGFISPTSVTYAIENAGLTAEAEAFIDGFRTQKKVDRAFLSRCAEHLAAQAVLIGVVDLWQKDEVDYRETAATPSTYVGATITILSLESGEVLFEASDENFLEGVESDASTRGVQTSGLGAVRSDPGSNVYAAPDPQEVAQKVVAALVSSIPVR
jgi:hypothetical protein